jgi:hypothetical protein
MSAYWTYASLCNCNRNCHEGCHDWTNKDNTKYWESLIGLETDKGIPTRTLCQKYYGTLKTKQKPVVVGGNYSQDVT